MLEAWRQRSLVERATRGDREAFTALVRPELDALYRTAYFLARDPDQAHDLTQMTCLRAYQAMPTFHVGAPLRPWLQRILRNLFLDHRKSAAVRHEVHVDWAEPPDEATGDADAAAPVSPLEVLLAREQQAALTDHIRCLPPDFQEILVLCDVQDMSYAEVCQITGLALGTVKSRLSRARLMLRGRLVGAGEPGTPASRSVKRGVP